MTARRASSTASCGRCSPSISALIVLIALALPGDAKRVLSALGDLHGGAGDPLGRDPRPLADRRRALGARPIRSGAGALRAGGGAGTRPRPVCDLVRAALRRRRDQGVPAVPLSGAAARRAEPDAGGRRRCNPAPALRRRRARHGRRVRIGDHATTRSEPCRWRASPPAPSRSHTSSGSSGISTGRRPRWIRDPRLGRRLRPAGSPSLGCGRLPAGSSRAGWRSKVSNLHLVTALLTVLVVFAPVLSPQFLLWILPVSACAYGLGKENLLLLVAILLTQIALQNYDGVDRADGRLRLAARRQKRLSARLPLSRRRPDPAGGTRVRPGRRARRPHAVAR